MKTRSIAFRLISAVLLVELLSAVLVILLSLGYERHIHFRAFEVMLHGRADSVLGAVQDAEDVGDNVMLDVADLHVPPRDVYEVWDGRGHLLGRSANWQGSAAMRVPDHEGISHIKLLHHGYGLLYMRGTRKVDPGEPGGGKLRFVTILYGASTDPVWHAIRGAVEFYAAGSLLLLAVTGPLIAWLLHRGLLPLRQLAALASDVSVDSWDFSPPASARETAELAPLTHAIENVLQRLERSFIQQRTFVSDGAHELKTAVAVVKSSLQLLELKQRTPAEYHAGLERCLTDTQRLEDLVAKMLTLARVESGAGSTGATAHSDLMACVRQTVADLATFAALRNIDVVVATPSGEQKSRAKGIEQESCPVEGTGFSPYIQSTESARASAPEESFSRAPVPEEVAPAEPSQVACAVPLSNEDCSLLISNLLMNALQHSPLASNVALRVLNEAGTVQLIIQDHGDGIDPGALPHIFDRFYRGDPSRARSTGGAGLGLAICKAVVEKAGGAIELKSEPGKGTTATVRLPMPAGPNPNS
jgi:signal transduction histidine kinase